MSSVTQIKKEITTLVKKYNTLACPKMGVPRLTKSGNVKKEVRS